MAIHSMREFNISNFLHDFEQPIRMKRSGRMGVKEEVFYDNCFG